MRSSRPKLRNRGAPKKAEASATCRQFCKSLTLREWLPAALGGLGQHAFEAAAQARLETHARLVTQIALGTADVGEAVADIARAHRLVQRINSRAEQGVQLGD